MKKYWGHLIGLGLFASFLALAGPTSSTYLTGQFLRNGANSFTIPSIGGPDQLVMRTSTDTLTNKSIDGGSNTFTNLPAATALTGVVPILNGGTGQSTTSGAINALLPSQGSSSGDCLTTNGTNIAWATCGSGGGSGTVTSVGMTVPSFLSISGSPITSSGTLALTLSGTALPIANGGTGQTTATAAITALLPSQASASGDCLTSDGTAASWGSCGSGGGGATSVGLADGSTTAIYAISGSPVTSSGTLTFTLNTEAANKVFAGPTSSTAQPTFRSLVSADIPTLNQNTTGTAANITGTSNSTLTTLSGLTTASSLTTVGTITSGTWTGTTIAIANGGTGQTSAANAINALLPSQTGNSGLFLTTNGTASSWASAGGGGAPTVTSQSSTYFVPSTNYTVNLSGTSFTVTLPTAVGAGSAPICLSNQGSGLAQQYAIATTSSQTVAGLASLAYILATPGETLCLYSDNANWQKLSHTTGMAIISLGVSTVSATAAYTFTIPSSSITIGSIYTNNSCTYIVSATTASSTTLTASGTCNPATSGTLTCVTCTPSGNLTFSARTITGVNTKGTTTGGGADLVTIQRNGHYGIVNFSYAQTATTGGAAGSGDAIFFIPGIVIDTSLIPIDQVAGSLNTIAGAQSLIPTSGFWTANGATGNNTSSAYLYASSVLGNISAFRLGMLYFVSGGTAEVSNMNSAMPSAGFTFNSASLAWNYTITIPVTGWQPL